ncbi:MAG: hypothetical protein LBH31_05430 [Burkholderiaceae bacterium]|jgi:hypothetical protein|nr:hypothetical protein [Burkholderiaceae bacterium]
MKRFGLQTRFQCRAGGVARHGVAQSLTIHLTDSQGAMTLCGKARSGGLISFSPQCCNSQNSFWPIRTYPHKFTKLFCVMAK